MKNVITTLKIKIVVFFLVFSTFLIPCFIFADSSGDTSPDLSSKGLSDDFVMASTLQINSLQATNYTTTDIYNLLYHCLREGANSAFGSIVDIHNDLNYYANNQNFSLAEVSTLSYFAIDNFYDTYFSQGLPMIADIDNNLITNNSKLEYIYTAIEDTINIKWYDPNITYMGTSITNSANFINGITTSNNFYTGFSSFNTNINPNNPSIVRVFLPITYSNDYYASSKKIELKNIYRYYNSNFSALSSLPDYFIESTNNGIYIYLFDFKPMWSNIFFNVYSSVSLKYNPNYTAYIRYIPFDTIDYQLIKSAFYQTKSGQGNDFLKKLADVYASDDLIQAKATQQDYENEVISEFTGNGASASKTSDKNGLKSVSGNIKSGLNTGGSINNALSVFDTSNSLWQFFSSTTQNNVDTRSGSNTRSINLRNCNDTILDFQTERDREYYTHLGE